MAERNYKEYVYWTIAVKKDSPAYNGVMRDAEEVKSKQYPTVAGLALQNYYKGLTPAPVPAPTQEQVDHNNGSEIVTTNQAKMAENVDAALDNW